jgi:hypothetical protein
MTIMISIGEWGGFYFYNHFTIRLCLGWVAFTFVPMDDADLMNWRDDQ